MKLTLVNVTYKQKRFSVFVMLPVNDAGKVYADRETILSLCNVHPTRGETVAW